MGFTSQETYAQLGLCSGNSGDPISSKSFGTGAINNELAPGTTTYTYSNDDYPDDGEYIVSNGTLGNGFDWHAIADHTPGDIDGKCLVVNAHTDPGGFYGARISGLCPSTRYEFSAWLINLVKAGGFCSSQPGGTIPVNVSFEIWDASNTFQIKTGTTGDILESETPNWQEYGLVFQTLAGQNEVILKMINNGAGGCGNDLAIDDIEFKSCGDVTTVTDAANNSSVNICSALTPFPIELTATPDFSVYASHFYQWQESSNGSLWSDIIGETNQSITILATSTTYYRAKIAELAGNLDNSFCTSFSNVFQATIIPSPSMPTLECWETATFNTATCAWEIIGTQATQPLAVNCWDNYQFDTATCAWVNNGIQPLQPPVECWETTTFNTSTCLWDVAGTQPIQPTIACWETATFNTTTCVWDVTVAQPIQQTIACWETATFNTTTCTWVVSGTQPDQPAAVNCWDNYQFNSTTCAWVNNGMQDQQPPIVSCWDIFEFNSTSCEWGNIGTKPGSVIEENIELCNDNNLRLQVQTIIPTPSYVWSTGAISEEISISTPGVYSVEITDGFCSFETIVYNVISPEAPIIESVVSNGIDIIIKTANSGDFLYSLDGISYQSNTIFYGVAGGMYTIYVKNSACNTVVNAQHLHFYIPKFFTPNNDGINDTFNLSGIENYGGTQVAIYDRYGKLLKYSRDVAFEWDGTYNSQSLPSGDYWYHIIITGQLFTGHFTLKR